MHRSFTLVDFASDCIVNQLSHARITPEFHRLVIEHRLRPEFLGFAEGVPIEFGGYAKKSGEPVRKKITNKTHLSPRCFLAGFFSNNNSNVMQPVTGSFRFCDIEVHNSPARCRNETFRLRRLVLGRQALCYEVSNRKLRE